MNDLNNGEGSSSGNTPRKAVKSRKTPRAVGTNTNEVVAFVKAFEFAEDECIENE